MSIYDNYIGEYFAGYFKNMKSDLAVRDRYLESQISDAGIIEFLLQKFLRTDKSAFENDTGSTRDGRQYEIRFNDSGQYRIISYFKNGKADMGYKPPALKTSDVAVKNINLRFSLLDLYCKINGIDDYSPAIVDLKERYKEDINSLFIKELTPNFIRNSFPSVGICENTHHYLKDGLHTLLSVTVQYFGDRKIFIPQFYGDSNNNFWGEYPFYPKMKSPLIFNSFYLNLFKNAIVILTDSIELAGINQQYLLSQNITDIVWISFYRIEDIAQTDWSDLKGRRVYYVLKEHSGIGTNEIYRTSSLLEPEIIRVIGKENFRYVSYLFNLAKNDYQSLYSRKTPLIYSIEEFRNARTNLLSKTLSLQHFINHGYQNKLLMFPLLYERTVTLIYGKISAETSLLLTILAYASSQGERVFEGWSFQNKSLKTLYLFPQGNIENVTNHIDLAHRIFRARKTQNHSTSDSSDFMPKAINHFQLPQDWSLQNEIIFKTQQIGTGGILFINNLFNLIDDNSIVFLNNLSFELKRMDWTIVIADSNDKSPSKNLELNSKICIAPNSSKDPNLKKIPVKIEKSFTPLNKSEKSFICEIDCSNYDSPILKRLKDYRKTWTKNLKIPREELTQKIIDVYRSHPLYTDRQAAEELEISLSTLKAIKRASGISKPWGHKKGEKLLPNNYPPKNFFEPYKEELINSGYNIYKNFQFFYSLAKHHCEVGWLLKPMINRYYCYI